MTKISTPITLLIIWLLLSACSAPKPPSPSGIEYSMNTQDLDKIKKYYIAETNKLNKNTWWAKSYCFSCGLSENDQVKFYYYLHHANIILIEGSERDVLSTKNLLTREGANPNNFLLKIKNTSSQNTDILFIGDQRS